MALAGLIALGAATAPAQVVQRQVRVNGAPLEDLPEEVRAAVEQLVKPHAGGIAGAFESAPADVAPATYLGVSTVPVPAALGKHLGLPEGIGLQVVALDPEGPAAGALERDDVLHRLGDQLLSHPDQLAALVRGFKKGERVTLTVIRTGQPRTVEVSLSEKELPSLEALRARQSFSGFPGSGVVSRRIVTRGPDGAVEQRATVTAGAETVMITTDPNGNRTVRVTGRDGKIVFEGPVATDEDLDKVPAEVRESVQRALDVEQGRFFGVSARVSDRPYDGGAPAELKVSLSMEDVSLQDALEMLSDVSGIPIEIRGGPLPETTITVKVTDTPFREALKHVAETAKLSYAIVDGRVIITVGAPKP